MDEDCTSVGFSGSGRCVERAVVDRMDDDGRLHRSCFEHFVRPNWVTFTEHAEGIE